MDLTKAFNCVYSPFFCIAEVAQAGEQNNNESSKNDRF